MNASDPDVISTPWGSIERTEVIAEGIERVYTACHGGYVLSEARQVEMPEHLSNGTRFYEEDSEASLVCLGLPQYFKNDARDALFNLSSPSICIVGIASMPRNNTSELAQIERVSDIFNDKTPTNLYPTIIPLTEAEIDVIDYLCECVFRNMRPISVPDDINPTLQDWVETLAKCIKVDGKWPISGIRWKKHFLKTDW